MKMDISKLFSRILFYNSLCIIPLLIIIQNIPLSSSQKIYTSQFAVECKSRDEAIKIAARNGFEFQDKVIDNVYLMESPRLQKRSAEKCVKHEEIFKSEKEVLWFEQQHIKKRTKRDFTNDPDHVSKFSKRKSNYTIDNFTDVLYKKQWYYHHGASGGHDMNVVPVWKMGITGKNVVVTILDDGIQTDHPDLVDNYDPEASFDINDNDGDPMPRNNQDNKHGTRCAGEVASMAFNSFCGIGIAYNAKIGGVRMLDGRVTDAVEARALGHNPQHVDIYSASWGPEDTGATVDGPGRLAKLAFSNGITQGRQGKGSIFVWASGNGGRYSDNCNCDGYTNSIYTLSISSATNRNEKPWYLEQCSSTVATTYSSGRRNTNPNIVTVDMDRTYLDNLKAGRRADPATLCTEEHTGTSASAPMAAGMCALALEANPNLTWRDMQHIVIMTSRYEPLKNESGWSTNGINRKISHKFGYGLMDGEQMVKLASKWVTVPAQRKCDSDEYNVQMSIPSKYHGMVESEIVIDGCKNTRSEIRYLEHVQATITLNFKPRGNILIKLVSPMGTHSTLLFPRPHDMNDDSFNNWPFLSVHFWGENPIGTWKLTVLNAGVSLALSSGILKKWSLTMFGTYENPVSYHSNSSNIPHTSTSYIGPCHSECVSGCFGKGSNQCYVCKHYQMETGSRECVPSCPVHHYMDAGICKKCHYTCKTCFGPDSSCQSCMEGYFFKMDEMSCVTKCPMGFFTDVENQRCVPCDSQCKSCSKSSHLCDECADGLVKVGTYECQSNCPGHSYHSPTFNRCEQCSAFCKECFGSQSNQCSSCNSPKLLSNNTCVNECETTAVADLENRICLKCNPICKQCSNLNTCDICSEGYKLIQSKCYPEGSCSSGQCTCPENCDKCLKSDEIKCLSCSISYSLMNGHCIKNCPDGYYSNNGICWPCFGNCKRCHGNNIGECNSCLEKFVLFEGKCLPACPQGYYKARGGICKACNDSCKTCLSENICVSCHKDRYYLSRSCLKTCPVGFYSSDSQHCLKCHNTCSTCTGSDAFSCSSCRSGERTSQGNCVPCPYNKYFNEEKKVCEFCHQSCKTCHGPLKQNCDSCVLPLNFESITHRCVPCCPTVKRPSYSCCYCDSHTGLCSNTKLGFFYKDSEAASSNTSSDNLFILKWMSVIFCLAVIALFFVVFLLLQFCSKNKSSAKYEPLSQDYDAVMEKVSLTADDIEEDEAFVHS